MNHQKNLTILLVLTMIMKKEIKILKQNNKIRILNLQLYQNYIQKKWLIKNILIKVWIC